MTQEEKDLLFKDLCGRLPYGVKVNDGIQGDFTLIGLTNERVFTTCEIEGCHNDFPIDLIKPYLFPLSSMNLDQIIEYSRTLIIFNETQCSQTSETYDWLNKNNFDYRGLIEKGLAIDATGLNIY